MSEHSHPGHAGPRRTLSRGLVAFAVLACAALLAACGGSSGGAASASPSPTPVPSPLVTEGPPPAAAVDVVRQFWTLVGEGRLGAAQRTLVAPGSPIEDWTGDDLAAHFVRLVPDSVGGAPEEGATVEFSVIVWIDAGPSQSSPWGDPGEHQLFEHVVRMSDGTWRMWDSGTGP